uniref:Uncharacterized protein n=1 Tax=Ditylenchus dipsaci TaxID=166011 RepID=A0A915DR94_9BILA
MDYLFLVYLPIQTSNGGLIRQIAFLAHNMPDPTADIWIGESLRKELSLPSGKTTINDSMQTITFGDHVLPMIAAIKSSARQCLSKESESRLLIHLLSFTAFPSQILVWIPEHLKHQIKKLALAFIRRGCKQLLKALQDVLENLEGPGRERAQQMPDLSVLLQELAELRQEVSCLRKSSQLPVLAMIDFEPKPLEVHPVDIQDEVEKKLNELKVNYKDQIASYGNTIYYELNTKRLVNFSVLGNCSIDDLCEAYDSFSSTSTTSHVEKNTYQASVSQYQLAMTMETIKQLKSVYGIIPCNLLWQELDSRITSAEEKYLTEKLNFKVHRAEELNTFAGFDGDLSAKNGITLLVAVHEEIIKSLTLFAPLTNRNPHKDIVNFASVSKITFKLALRRFQQTRKEAEKLFEYMASASRP